LVNDTLFENVHTMFIDIELGWEFTDDEGEEEEEEAVADQEDMAPEAEVADQAPVDTGVTNPSEAMEPSPETTTDSEEPAQSEPSEAEPTQADPA
jgi:hypothetical protein